MNVLLSSCVHWWNAEAAYAAQVARVLLADGHRVSVLARPGTRNCAELEARGLPVRSDVPLWAANPLVRLAAVARLRALQRSEGIDVVNVFHARELPLHVLAARGAPTRVVRTRGSARPTKGHALNRWLHRAGCQGLVASAEVVRRQMLGALRVPPEAVRTIYYPADPHPLPPPEARAAWRRELLAELGMAPEATVLAIVGRAAPEKGHERLLDALPALLARHPQVVVLVLAKSYPGEEAAVAVLRARAEALGVAAHVRWAGYREDVAALMAAADVGVIPSVTSETNCRVAVEFFAAGTPVVAFPTGALPEVVEAGVSGTVAEAHTHEALAAALAPLLADPALRASLGAGARRAAETRFAPERFRDETLAVYEAALRR